MRILDNWLRFIRLTRYYLRQGHSRGIARRLARMAQPCNLNNPKVSRAR